jgi:hypothetical protein
VLLFKTANAVTKCYVTAVAVSTKNASLWTRKGKLFPRKGLWERIETAKLCKFSTAGQDLQFPVFADAPVTDHRRQFFTNI